MDKAYADEQLEYVFNEYGKAIENFCYVRLGEANEFTYDCVQDTYCVFYRKLLDGEIIKNPRAFLYKTASNMVFKAREKYFSNAKRNKSLDEVKNISVSIDDEIDNKFDEKLDLEKVKTKLLSQLSEAEKRLYKLKYEENKSLNDISLILDITPTAVAKRTSRLRKKITDLVNPTLEDFRKGDNWYEHYGKRKNIIRYF